MSQRHYFVEEKTVVCLQEPKSNCEYKNAKAVFMSWSVNSRNTVVVSAFLSDDTCRHTAPTWFQRERPDQSIVPPLADVLTQTPALCQESPVPQALSLIRDLFAIAFSKSYALVQPAMRYFSKNCCWRERTECTGVIWLPLWNHASSAHQNIKQVLVNCRGWCRTTRSI